jgi:hypothetical protein
MRPVALSSLLCSSFASVRFSSCNFSGKPHSRPSFEVAIWRSEPCGLKRPENCCPLISALASQASLLSLKRAARSGTSHRLMVRFAHHPRAVCCCWL